MNFTVLAVLTGIIYALYACSNVTEGKKSERLMWTSVFFLLVAIRVAWLGAYDVWFADWTGVARFACSALTAVALPIGWMLIFAYVTQKIFGHTKLFHRLMVPPTGAPRRGS